MNGRELIIYILENGLENESIFKDGFFLGFISSDQAAALLGVGTATIEAWIALRVIDGYAVDDKVYILPNDKWRAIKATCRVGE